MRTELARIIVVVVLGSIGCGGGSHEIDAAPAPVPDVAVPTESSCFDGLDDDGNGLADCAEPTCAGVATCAPAIPADWSGYTELYDGSFVGAPACSAPFVTMLAPGSSGLTAPAATCTGCACGPASGGVCAPSGGTASTTPATWTSYAVACETTAPAAIGCTGTDVCHPRPAAPFGATLCIHHDGDLACPAGTFTQRHLFYAGLFDTRGCAQCGCDAPIAGACAANGGAPNGSAMALSPSTYCCLP